MVPGKIPPNLICYDSQSSKEKPCLAMDLEERNSQVGEKRSTIELIVLLCWIGSAICVEA